MEHITKPFSDVKYNGLILGLLTSPSIGVRLEVGKPPKVDARFRRTEETLPSNSVVFSFRAAEAITSYYQE